MSVKSVKHIAIAVNDLEKSAELFARLLDSKPGRIVEVPDQKVRVCFIRIGMIKIELVAPMDGNASLAKFLETRGEGLHHICLGVEHIEGILDAYHDSGIKLIDRTPRQGAQGHKVAFLHPKSTAGVLIELEESE